MLRDSVVVVVVVVRTRPRAIPLAMIAIRKILHGFPFPSRDAFGAPLGGPSGRRSSAIKLVHDIEVTPGPDHKPNKERSTSSKNNNNIKVAHLNVRSLKNRGHFI